MARIYVVDVSSVQIDADWKKVAAHDPGAAFGVPPGRIAGCIAKASEGARGVDPETRMHLEGAQEQGLVTGIYHFARAGAGPAREQADRVVDLGLGVGDDPGELPVWLDCEEKGISDRLGGDSAYVDWILTWCDRIREQRHRAGIYSAPVYGPEWQQGARVAELAQYPLWVAQYSRIGPWAPTDAQRPMKLAPWKEWAIWQFSGGGPGLPGNTVPGFGEGNYVDLNLVADGAWRMLLGTEPVEPNEDMGGIVHESPVDWVLEQRENDRRARE
jgi:lysozyme